MTTLSWVPRINITKTVVATPTISVSPAYTSGDQLGDIMTLTDVVRQDSNTGKGFAELAEITILDRSGQSAALDVWFFKVSPTVTSADNAAFSMSGANQVLQCIGQVQLAAANYSAAALNSTGSWPNLNKCMQVDGTSSTPTTIYAIAITRGTPTYATTSALQFQFSFYVD